MYLLSVLPREKMVCTILGLSAGIWEIKIVYQMTDRVVAGGMSEGSSSII